MSSGKTNQGKRINWIILGALGLFLIIGRHMAKDLLYRILGIGLMLASGAIVADWLKDKNRKQDSAVFLMGGVLVFFIGLWILFHPGTLDRFINVLIGGVLIVCGIQWLTRGSSGKKDSFTIALSVGSIILGTVIAFTNAATTWLVIAEGFGLIFAAINGAVAERGEKE